MPPDFRKKMTQKQARGEAAPMGGAPEQTGLAIRQAARYELAERIDLPPEAAELDTELQEIARHYISARRRTGEALLDAARWLAEARERTEHGGWDIFLRVTQTSSDTAERLRLIHERATQLPAFRAAIVDGWFTESAAWRLSRPSAPESAIARLLDIPAPPTVKQVEATIKAARTATSNTASPRQHPAEGQIPPRGGIWLHTPDTPHPTEGTTIAPLDTDERTMVARLTDKIAHYAGYPEGVSDDDWQILLPLARVLAQMLHQRSG